MGFVGGKECAGDCDGYDTVGADGLLMIFTLWGVIMFVLRLLDSCAEARDTVCCVGCVHANGVAIYRLVN